jgi:adenine-specific DNA-methyltransferase
MIEKTIGKTEARKGFIQIPAKNRKEFTEAIPLPSEILLNGETARLDSYGRLWSSSFKGKFPFGSRVHLTKTTGGFKVELVSNSDKGAFRSTPLRSENIVRVSNPEKAEKIPLKSFTPGRCIKEVMKTANRALGRSLEFTLAYKGKESEESILKNTPIAQFREVKTLGKFMKLENQDDWFNMLIFGDNLRVLKTLLDNPNVNGKVRLVYIDPPFSTNHEFRGGDKRTSTVSFSREDTSAYEDMLVGADYLEFLRKRLILLKELLAVNGSIYVHIDWKMGHYVKIVMDEIFGVEHFINDIARVKCNPKNFPRSAYGNVKDMILFYSKTDNFVWNASLERYTEEDIRRLFPKMNKDGRRYTTNPLHAPGETKNGPTGQPWRGMLPPKGRHWRCSPAVLEELDKQGRIEWSGTGNPRKIIYADERVREKKKRQDIWEFKDPAYPDYPTQKNLEMLEAIIKASSSPNDLVLDCFCGSGTTLIASEKLGRKWIGIDNSPLAIKVTIERALSLENPATFKLYNANNELLTQTLQEALQK